MDADQGDIDPPSDQSHDESDEDIGDADPQFYRLHDRIDEKHHAADMIANCRIKANATRAGVRAAVTDWWKTDRGQVNASIDKSYYDYIPKSSPFLGVRVDRINIGSNDFQMRPVRETFQYVSLKDILKMVARKETIMEYVRNQRPHDEDLLRSFTDGDIFRNHPFFQAFPDAFQLALYYDDVETANPIGSQTGTHMLSFFAVKILNVPPYLNSVFGGYHVIALAHKTDVEKYGFRPILQNFIDECLEFESREGVETFIRDQRIVQRACVCAVIGDTKAVHEILGFLSASARHFCRLCLISRPQLQNGVIIGEPRTAALHAVHVQEVMGNPDRSLYNGLRSANANHNLVGTSAQIFCLLRILPFLLDNLGATPDDDRHLDLLLILQQIVQIVRAPVLSRALMPYLQDLIADHRRLFQELFPALDPINKHHHLEHYVTCILKMGPLEQYNCMRAEASMRPLKRHVVSCNSYRDVRKTAGEYTQIAQAVKWGSNHPNVVPQFELQSKKWPTAVRDCHLAAILLERGFDDEDILHKVSAVSVYGREYLLNSVHSGQVDTAPDSEAKDLLFFVRVEAFAKIIGIISANGDEDVWLELEEWETDFLHPRFNACVSNPLAVCA
ncbi:TY1 enhancer activator [Frankliniella fusca]|uniref:TY1 enhancer activator n=1 Tax=Frankliniella fusca TaxID=407009 RepID=A0AAE1LG21_9NEOP|nr:TY1 enhancer activator [Frankliniella fusca]